MKGSIAQRVKNLRLMKENPSLGLFQSIEMMRGQLANEVESQVKQLGTDLTKKIEDMFSKSEKGKDGKDADESKIVESVMRQIRAEGIRKPPTATELIPLIKSLIPAPKDGKSPSRTDLIKIIRPLIPDIQIPRSLTHEEVGDIAKSVLSPITVQDVVDAINAKPELINLKSVKGVDKAFNSFLRSIKSKQDLVVRGGGDEVFLQDLSSLTNGTAKAFSVPKHRKPIALLSSDAPFLMFPNNGFTISVDTLTITLTTDHAPSRGSQLGYIYVR